MLYISFLLLNQLSTSSYIFPDSVTLLIDMELIWYSFLATTQSHVLHIVPMINPSYVNVFIFL